VLLKDLPPPVRESVEAYVGCIAGAITVGEYQNLAEASGLGSIKVTTTLPGACCPGPDTEDPLGKAVLASLKEGESISDYVTSVYVEGCK